MMQMNEYTSGLPVFTGIEAIDTIIALVLSIAGLVYFRNERKKKQQIRNQKELEPTELRHRKETPAQTQIKSKTITLETFFLIRQRSTKRYNARIPSLSSETFTGVYILHNKTKNKHYVGQAGDILDRINQHFTGRGNEDIYIDYLQGDKWSIELHALDETNFSTLNALEKHLI